MFITFEGGEGSGKSTIVRMLKEKLDSDQTIFLREPGSSPISESIREIILDKNNTDMDPRTEALLYAASRAQLVNTIIVPALKENKLVICDRYLDSSLVYQGYARGLDVVEIMNINSFGINNIIPDITFYLDLAPTIGQQRIRKGNRETNRLDDEDLEFHVKVRNGFLDLAEKNKNRIIVIDANRPVTDVFKEVFKIINERIEK